MKFSESDPTGDFLEPRLRLGDRLGRSRQEKRPADFAALGELNIRGCAGAEGDGPSALRLAPRQAHNSVVSLGSSRAH